jgi:hypothetical protein
VIHRTCVVLLVAVVSLAPAPLRAQDPAATPASPGPVLQSLQLNGVTLYLDEELSRRAGLEPVGQPLGRSAEEIAEAVRQVYRDDGYILAEVVAQFDAASGVLTLTVDEGRFEAIRIDGLDDTARQAVLERLVLPTGEIFNVEQAARALNDALSVTQGAIVSTLQPFALETEAGRRVLRIALRAREGTGSVFLGTQGREDWYSPVDGLNVALGANGTIFDRHRFNHTYWSAFVSYKSAPGRTGYSFGLERAFLADGMLQLGGSIHDVTSSDDHWRLGDVEQSLVALTFRNTFRDYYRRKGFQLNAALRPLAAHEVMVAWRDEAHSTLVNETGYGFFRDDHAFRPNLPAVPGDLRSLLLGYTFDSRGLVEPRAPERYRRHLLDDLITEATGREQGVRVEWRSELAPASYGQDFDFARHIMTTRGWWAPSASRTVSGRLMAGVSSGTLPLQRVFALGGIGSVHGYSFKERAGDGMVLLNGEFRQQFGDSEFAGLAFLDLGRVYHRLDPRALQDASLVRRESWMKGIGVGFEFDGGARVEFGWRLDDIPDSLQVLFRLRPSF